MVEAKIKGWCQSETKVSQLISNSQLALVLFKSMQCYHFKIPEVQLLCTTDSPPYSLPDLPQTPIVLDLHKKFEVNQIKIKGSCQSHTARKSLVTLKQQKSDSFLT